MIDLSKWIENNSKIKQYIRMTQKLNMCLKIAV
jgi:hypothetical protein